MVLDGKFSVERRIKAPITKWFNLVTKQLHHVQNLCEKIHAAKLHQGDAWHDVGNSVKHWTYVIDGKVRTCHETIEAIDEENKTVIYKLYGEEIDQSYKTLKFILELFDKNNGGAAIKWSVEYEKINKDIEAPYGYVEFIDKCITDMDAYLIKA